MEPSARRRGGRPAKLYEADGVTRSLSEWAAVTGLSRNTLRKRMDRGASIADAISYPPGQGPPRRTDPEEHRSTVYLTRDVRSEIEEEAERLGQSFSWVVRQAWEIAAPVIRRIPSEAEERTMLGEE